MIIHHLAHKPFGKYRNELFSPLASVRLRALKIAPHLAALGHRIKIVPFEDVAAQLRAGAFHAADVYIMHKAFFDMSALLGEIRRQGKRIVIDVCENVMAVPHLRSFYPAMLEHADVITVSSEALAHTLHGRSGAPVVPIPDCVELRRGAPALGDMLSPVRLLWFGRSGNIEPLLEQLPALAAFAADTPCSLDVVCDITPDLRAKLDGQRGALAVAAVEWSPEALELALARCHMVILPSSDVPELATKSANRLQEALWAGRLPIAYPIDSFSRFGDAAVLITDLVKGIQWALANRETSLARIVAGQALIEKQFTPEAVAPSWDQAVRRAAAAPARPAPEARVRLNLGCGDKLLAGYVNIDIAEGRDGARPDMVCDLRKLADFADASADEVLAVHVVEHFWRWEVVDILKEWVRVLKPGGRLVLECPNLRAACEIFLSNPANFSRADARGQHTMWAFYGDPSWRDPLMAHRWGYTPDSLAEVMAEAGLIEIRQEAAQFKLREPRDMRMVALKPGSGA